MAVKYNKLYKKEDGFFEINKGDSVLECIRISLPKAPKDKTRIDNYGLHPDKQVYNRIKIPDKLKNAEKRAFHNLQDQEENNKNNTVTGYKLLEEFWKIIDEDEEYYEDCADLIKKIWYHRYYGQWIYLDGKPTWIPPRYYMFLNFFKLKGVLENGGYPEYRDRHRREYLFKYYLGTSDETFSELNENNEAVPDDKGNYDVVHVGHRLFFGDQMPKSRRNGSTAMGCSDSIEASETGIDKFSPIISMDGENAKKIYRDMLLPAWNSRPLFIMPVWDGNRTPKVIKYIAPANKFGVKQLGGIIEAIESADETKLDGRRIDGHHLADEEGKTKRSDVLERWDVNKRAMSLGDGSKILGTTSHPSTCEELEEGAEAYRKMFELSNFYKRTPDGQTFSGLVSGFFPAYDGQENFIDCFGNSVIDEPTDRQIRLTPKAGFARMKKGAKQFIVEKRDAYLKDGSPAALQSLRSYIRKMPIDSAEIWIGEAGDMGFDLLKIDERLAELRRLKAKNDPNAPVIRRGYFAWDNDNKDTRVVFIQDDERAKFEISMMPLKHERNKRVSTTGFNTFAQEETKMYEPENGNDFIIGADPHEFNNKTQAQLRESKSRMSDGGIAVFRTQDHTTDYSEFMEEWEGYKFVCMYKYRAANIDEFNEDVLMAAVFYGARVYLERNKTNTWEHFIRRGYGGYLLYDVDPLTGIIKSEPGYYASTAAKDEGFSLLRKYIDKRSHKEDFSIFLEDLKSIRGPEEMTKYDLIAAALAALLGSKSSYNKILENNTNTSQGNILRNFIKSTKRRY